MKHYDPNAEIDFLVKVRTMIQEAEDELALIRFNKGGYDEKFDAWLDKEFDKLAKIKAVTME